MWKAEFCHKRAGTRRVTQRTYDENTPTDMATLLSDLRTNLSVGASATVTSLNAGDKPAPFKPKLAVVR